MNKILCFVLFALLISSSAQGQTYRTLLRKANKEFELKAFNEAIQTYKDVLSRRADDPEALGYLGECYLYLNDIQEAQKYLVRAVAQSGVQSRHVLAYAHALKAGGRYDDAKRWYLEYAKDDPVVGNHYAQTCDFARSQQQLSSGLYVNNETQVNSPASDFGPVFYRGQVVFSSSRVDIQRAGATFSGQQPNQPYIARLGADGRLGSPFFLQANAQQYANKGPIAFSPDGRMVVYTKNNFVNGTRQIPEAGMDLNLFMAEINPNGEWVNEQAFPYNSTGESTGFPCFSPDGNALYFASNRQGGFGGFDIYVSYRAGATWGRPENLGPVINSPGNELTPFYDGENLFFASDWHPGFGGLDIFRAERLNNNWAQIFHLGNPVSSPRDDYGLVYDKLRNQGYFVSNREGGRGAEDIYSLARPAESVVLAVQNASDGTPVANAMLDFTNCGYGLQQTDDRGVYRLQVPGGINCTVVVRKDGFRDETIQLTANPQQQGSRQVDIQLVRRGEEYYGKILNYNNRMPVAGATVSAVNQLTGSTVNVQTDANGDYTLALTQNATYLIRYSAPGYRDINRTVRTTPGADPALLGTMSMLPSDTPAPPGTQPEPLYPYNPPTQPTGGAGGTTVTGYAVQVAALSKPGTSQFSNLQSIGTVYSKQENNMYKVRIGIFATQTQAQQALAAAKRMGYPKAFIVEDSAVQTTPTTTTGQQQQFTDRNPPATATGRYKIQLGAYRNPQSFDGSKLQGLGIIEDGRKGDLTVKYLSGFATIEQARAALPSVRAAGFTGAFILEQDAAGQLKRVQ